MKKIIFFDIDGTLWNEHNEIPESTTEAIKMLRDAGNLVFINSGRTRGFIRNPKLFALGFDGIISGAGTMLEYCREGRCSSTGDTVCMNKDDVIERKINDDNVIYYHRLDPELAEHTVETVKKYEFRPILEGKRYLYLDDSDFKGDPYGDRVIADMGEDRRQVSECWGRWEISKLSCATTSPMRDEGLKELGRDYRLMIHNKAVCEMVPQGFGKETGMKRLCGMLGVDIADTYAFGDSANDVAMLKAAGVGVAMGNGSDIAKAAADHVTDSMADGGIMNACKYLELI